MPLISSSLIIRKVNQICGCFLAQNVFAVVDIYGAVEAVTISSSALVESFTSLLSLPDDIITSDRLTQVPVLCFLFYHWGWGGWRVGWWWNFYASGGFLLGRICWRALRRACPSKCVAQLGSQVQSRLSIVLCFVARQGSWTECPALEDEKCVGAVCFWLTHVIQARCRTLSRSPVGKLGWLFSPWGWKARQKVCASGRQVKDSA